MDLNRAIQAAQKKVLSLGPKLDREIERLRQDIRSKIERGELSPEVERVFSKGE